MEIPAEGLRISLGCGRHVVEGWFCIDLQQHPTATRPIDMVSDVRKIALPDACARELMAIHLFEHLWRWEVDDVLEEWKRLLRPNGLLIMEMPDLMKCCQNIVSGNTHGRKFADQLGMWGLYGDPREQDPLMMHRWAWTFASIKPLLEEHGFHQVRQFATQFHPPGRDHRDFRVEARKGA